MDKLAPGVVRQCPGCVGVNTGALGANLMGLGVLLRRRAAPPKHPPKNRSRSALKQPERGLANFHSGFGRCWAGPDSMTYATTTLGRRGTKFPRFYKTGPLF